MPIAITRQISPRFNECEITHIERIPIDLGIARSQHEEYVRALKSPGCGCEVIELPAEPDLPDSVFVEDAAIILPEMAVITRPGADSRKPETESIARSLLPFKSLVRLKEPAALDGGDVLVLGKRIFVGLSTRSNQEAIDQLNALLAELGYSAMGVHLHDCLHLKSAVSRLDDQTLLINRNWLDTHHFEHFRLIDVDRDEPFAANCLPVGESIIYPTSFPKTCASLEEAGYKVVKVDMSELAKAEGAVTCCSLILQ
jgi:dimethylargininase